MPRHLVTAALSHFCAVGHPGTIGSSLLPADVYCRYLRARGEEVLFVCAGDEHGTAAERRAADAGVDVAGYCAALHQEWEGVAASLDLSFDVFGRSSSRWAVEQAQYFLRRLAQEGYIEARGGRHLLLLQSRLGREVRRWVDSRPGWSGAATALVADQLREGLEDRRITGDLSWGVPVEWTGFEGVRHDARFDAPIAHIGATREWAAKRGEPDAWRRWWRDSEEVRYVQFLGRGDVPFHAIGFHCALIGSREAWKLADVVAVPAGRATPAPGFPSSVAAGLAAGPDGEALPADCRRLLLLAEPPDADEARAPLAPASATAWLDDAVFAFAEHCLGIVAADFGATIPAGGEPGGEEEQLAADLDRAIEAISGRLAALEFPAALAELRVAWELGPSYLARKDPEQAPRGDRDAALSAAVCLNLIALLARLSAPLLPSTARLLLDALAVPAARRGWPARFELDALGPGHAIDKFGCGPGSRLNARRQVPRGGGE